MHLKQLSITPSVIWNDITKAEANISTTPLCPIMSDTTPKRGAIIATANVGIAYMLKDQSYNCSTSFYYVIIESVSQECVEIGIEWLEGAVHAGYYQTEAPEVRL